MVYDPRKLHQGIKRNTLTKNMKQTQESELIAELYSALRFLLADYIAIEGEKLTGSSAPVNIAQAALKRAEAWENHKTK